MQLLPVTKIECATAMRQPAHDQSVAANLLHSVNAEVLPFLARAARDDERPCHQWTYVIGPACLNRKYVEVNCITLDHYFLAGRIADFFRGKIQGLFEQWRLVP